MAGQNAVDVRQKRSTPRLTDGIVFETDLGPHLYLANGSRVFAVSSEFAQIFDGSLAADDAAGLDDLLSRYGLDAPPFVEDYPPPKFAPRSLSLAIAQKCNLGCAYCYAQQGDFGGPAKNMSEDVALASVERLIGGVKAGERVNLAFLGGEPLVNRALLRQTTEHAVRRGAECGVEVGFSITTNGTLLRPDDAEFFERHGFAVTVSLDGIGDAHDKLRPYKGGRGSFDRIVAKVRPLLAAQRRMQVSARVTVTPSNLDLAETLDALIGLGFHSVGFSPMLRSPNGQAEMDAGALDEMLEQMIRCGQAFERAIGNGRRYPFLNMVNALKEIHKGTHRPYPCGAGAGYLGVSAEGGLFACHRFVDDDAGAMGDIWNGLDGGARQKWMSERHVHFQEPCARCWARYMCGGGCHHEVIERGRPSCDYIRGWLRYCLAAYVKLVDRAPAYFGLKSDDGRPALRTGPVSSAPS